jgi:predicted molibdopterin-dependent oxidoreductase YjgC
MSGEERRIDKILDFIPSASQLKETRKVLREKRVRIRYDNELDEEEARISTRLARELGIKDYLEIVVAGKKRFAFRALIEDDVEENVVYVNGDLMEEHGIADNSIATVRAHKGGEKLGVRLDISSEE